MKNVKFLYILIAVFILTFSSNSYAEFIGPVKSAIYKCVKKEIGRSAYDGRNVDAAIVTVTKTEIYNSEDISLTILTTIICNGTGPSECPTCPKAMIKNEKDYNITQDFLTQSADLMEAYMYERIANGIFVGSQSFNTVFNNFPILRNISWELDKVKDEVEIIINIIELIDGTIPY